MKQIRQLLNFIVLAALIFAQCIPLKVSSQGMEHESRLVICGGGSLPDTIFKEFRKLAGSQARLVVIPTASKGDFEVKAIRELWQSRGFPVISVLHTNDRKVASSARFAEPLRIATAVWFSGGAQQRIADAYIGTPVEKELLQLLRRGGVIGGSSAGAAIHSRVMIKGGKGSQPKISTGFDLLKGSIVDQHFLTRNRISRLLTAIQTHPQLIGFGIDEGTALVISDGKCTVVGSSYVLRIEFVEGTINVDAFSNGDTVPLVVR